MDRRTLPILLTAILCGLVSGTHRTYRSVKMIHRLASGVSLDRYKRENNELGPEAMAVAMSCSMQCMVAMKSELAQVMGEQELAIGANFDQKMFNQEAFETVCDSYKNMHDCVGQCGNFDNKRTILAVFRPLDYVCVERYDDFVRNLPCYEKARSSVERLCFGKCGDFDKFEQIMTNVRLLYGMAPPDQIVDFFEQLCNYTQCLLSCMTPIYNTLCTSPSAALLQHRFVSESISATQKLLDQSGRRVLFPENCKALTESDPLISTPVTPQIDPKSTQIHKPKFEAVTQDNSSGRCSFNSAVLIVILISFVFW